jgi:hypothetical protein
LRIDQAVAARVLETLQPAGVEAAIAAWEAARTDEDQKHRSLRLALQKAQYEADRVRRQYDAVDPGNRLVAGELEQRWNQSLERVAELEQRLSAAVPVDPGLTEPQRSRLLELGKDLVSLWHHPEAPVTLKKRILRTVLEEIVADVREEASEVHLWLHWAGGIHTELRVPKNRPGQHRHCTDRQVIDLVRDLAKVCDDGSTASILNRLGYRTGTGKTWNQSRVRSLRSSHDIPQLPPTESRPWLTLEQAADALEVSPHFVRKLLQRRILPGQQVVKHAPWVIRREDLHLPAVQAAVEAAHAGRRVPSHLAMDSATPLFAGM